MHNQNNNSLVKSGDSSDGSEIGGSNLRSRTGCLKKIKSPKSKEEKKAMKDKRKYEEEEEIKTLQEEGQQLACKLALNELRFNPNNLCLFGNSTKSYPVSSCVPDHFKFTKQLKIQKL